MPRPSAEHATVRVTLAQPDGGLGSTGRGSPIVRAGRTLRAVVRWRRPAAGPLDLEVVTALGVVAWRQRLAVAATAAVEAEIPLPRDWPSGGTRLVARDPVSGAADALRVEFVAAVPVRPVWRYGQRILLREARETTRVEVPALVPRGMPLKLAVHPPPAAGRAGEATHDDAYGNRWAHASFDAASLDAAGVRGAHGRTPSGRRRPARPLLVRERDLISFTTAAHLPSLQTAAAPAQPLPPPRHYSRFLEPERSIESDAPEVLALAEVVPHAAAAGPLAVCEAAHDVVHQHMRYVIQRGEFGARYAARRGVGDCTEYAALFVALCRARGVPARVAAGIFPDERDSAHATAEVYLYGQWFGLDPTNQRTFHIGLPAAFVPMMRANWMSGETAYRPFAATLESRGRMPEIGLREVFTRTATLLPAASGQEPAPESELVPWIGGEWLARERRRPTMSVVLAPPAPPVPEPEPEPERRRPGQVSVWLVNDTAVTWRVQVVAAVEPRTPLVYAVTECQLGPGEGAAVVLPHPYDVPGLLGCEGLLIGAYAGEKLLDAQVFA